MGLRMINFIILGVHWKIWLLGGKVHKKNNIEGGLPKKGGLDSLARKNVVVFLMGGLIPRCTLCLHKYNKNCHSQIEETVPCKSAAETSKWIIATETVTCMIATERSTKITVTESTTCIVATEPQNLLICNRLCHLHNCYREC